MVAASAAAVAVSGLVVWPAGSAAADVPSGLRDGSSSAAAAASCYEAKLANPGAVSGLYWLVTPELGAPEQFYCDQTTDGGGWVLIGRGREGWNLSNEGRGTAAQVREVVTGTGAFAPRQLPSKTVEALLNGEPVSSLSDGVRLRRAENIAGTQWQEVRFTFATPRDTWSWYISGYQRAAQWSITSASGVVRTGGSTELSTFGADQQLRRVTTTTSSSMSWNLGFAYGTQARGNPASSSYLWAASTSTGNPLPFTQVYLRPQLISSELFSEIDDAGTPAVEQASVISSFPSSNAWGVTGLGAAGSGIQNTEVSAFAEIDGVMYVGGNFRYVQRDSAGTSRVEQSYLAAFDVVSGEWISGFRPVLNNQVKSLAALPNGTLAVGGDFTQVNGVATAALTVLDPATGAAVAGVPQMLNLAGGTAASVRSLDVQDGFLYLGGRFTHLTGQYANVYARNLARIDLASMTADGSWNQELLGTVISLDASEQGDRVYAAGYFDQGAGALRAGAFLTAGVGFVPWTVDFSAAGSRLSYQQAVLEVGDTVWLGGSEHMLFTYDRASMTESSTNITQSGGDFQALGADQGQVYGGCHCSQANYEGADTWPSIGQAWDSAEHIHQTGVWDAESLSYVPAFSPWFTMREGAGTWALTTDSTGVTWMGGDFTHARRTTTTNMWTGGFVRFERVDSTAPATPAGLSVQALDGVDALSWSASADPAGPGGGGAAVTYHVLLEDRVVATTSDTSIELPTGPVGSRYFVRAADASGNFSASTPAVVATDPEPEPVVLVGAGEQWSYLFGQVPEQGWQVAGFDASGWSQGAAPLGWGHTGLGTTLEAGTPRPLVSYYRRSVTVSDASEVESVTLTTRADDGVVVFVNGVEVVRQNLPEGVVGEGTYALSAVGAAAALANPVTVEVPGWAWVTGENVISVQVHSNYRNTPSHSFELTATVND